MIPSRTTYSTPPPPKGPGPPALCPAGALSQAHPLGWRVSQPKAHVYKLAALRPRSRTKPSVLQGTTPMALGLLSASLIPWGGSPFPCFPPLLLLFHHPPFPGGLGAWQPHTQVSLLSWKLIPLCQPSGPTIFIPVPWGLGRLTRDAFHLFSPHC